MNNEVSVRTSGWEMDSRPVDIVVISSQLAYGAVGNTASARVLTEAGYRCVQVPTVILSALPHYPGVHGGPLPDDWFAGILDDLIGLGALAEVRYVLVGFLAHSGQAAVIAEWFAALRTKVPGVRLVVDPAMGDDDVGLYTDPAVAASYARHLVPLATGLTPNRFELAMLSGRELVAADDVAAAAAALRPDGGWLIVTSADPTGTAVISNLVATEEGTRTVRNERLRTGAKGAGDIYAATVVARLLAGADISVAADDAGRAVADTIREAPRV
ncbi:pyridoxine kinase [Paramicrobacterium humi]|uniref:pyridoxal kinase n=1 Tax=Paramicrobacterium humi TaxID=640635 RepID=A0A1H4TUC0_9MICO|nr:PfkB family carbohydrate kinase [Microbacterium humi]SEC59634.1 pyridoxine kinase [Microbacterium humi]